MAALSGHNSLYLRKLVLKKPAPEKGRSDVFDLFLRKASVAQYQNGSWDDPRRLVCVQDLLRFAQDHHFQGIPGRDGLPSL
jgi:hypothetical protein